MGFLVISFIAGVLTVLAPCILPLLPVVIGSSASGRSRFTPYIVVGSLASSIIVFTYALKASTALIMIPPVFWNYLSGGILAVFGLVLLFPGLWEKVPGLYRVSVSSNKLMGSGYQRKNIIGDIIIGASLGPIFSTCSPTYFIILASILPVSFTLGTVYLFSYVLGLSFVLLLIALLGQRFTNRLAWASNPNGIFKRGVGVFFLVLGLLIATGYEKKLETAILDGGYFDITKLEQLILQKQNSPTKSPNPVIENMAIEATKAEKPYQEIVSPSGFVNSGPFRLKDLVGKKVILVDFLTYSCINCQRTFPYLNVWYEKYKDQGLEIVGIHTPEFAFEKDINNVRDAMKKFDITHPIVLDNEYATWRAYGNRYWPRKYLIDIHGNIVYDHIGEGAYEETEMKIRDLLDERAKVLGEQTSLDRGELTTNSIPQKVTQSKSPETYFGSLRNKYLANGSQGVPGTQTLMAPETFLPNALYLSGTWSITPEYAESIKGASVFYRYNAREMYLVAESDEPVSVEIIQDGKIETITIYRSTLYTIVSNPEPEEHTIEIRIGSEKVRLYAFTFG